MFDLFLTLLSLLSVLVTVFSLVTLVQVLRLGRSTGEICQRLQALERRLDAAPPAPSVVRTETPASVTPPLPVPPPATVTAKPAAYQAPHTQKARAQSEQTRAPHVLNSFWQQVWNWFAIGAADRKPGDSWEYAIATHWLLRIGILTALAGVAFFLKYSIEQGLMGPLGRVILSLCAGVFLIVLGMRLLFKRYHLLGQGLAGAGFAVLYFAFYAAAMFYHLLTPGLAFALTACVTLAAGFLAVWYRSLGIALLGLVGGYLAPLLLGHASVNYLALYAYLLLLGCGLLVVSLLRRWPVLNILGMLAAYGLSLTVCSGRLQATEIWHGLIFLSCVHLLFLFSIAAFNLRPQRLSDIFERVALCLNATIYWCWVYFLFEPGVGRMATGLVALALAAVYALLAGYCSRRQVVDRGAWALFTALGAIFLLLVPVFLLTGEWLTLAWSLQALALLWVTRQLRQPGWLKAGLALFALAVLRNFLRDYSHFYYFAGPGLLDSGAFWRAAGLRLLLVGSLPAMLTAAWYLLRGQRHGNKLPALILAQLWLYLTCEVNVIAAKFIPGFHQGAITLMWTLFALALTVAGLRLGNQWLRWGGLGFFVLAIFKLLFSDLEELGTLYRIIAFMAVGVLLVLGAFVYLHYRPLLVSEKEAAAED